MRGGLLIAGGVLVVALVLGCGAVNRSTRSTQSKPSISISRAAPLTVHGRHFHASEIVRVSAGSRFARAKANGSGDFVVTIPGADRCNTLRILARGSAGSYTIVKLLPAPMCAPTGSSG